MLKRIENLSTVLGIICLVIILLLTMSDVVRRYLFNSAIGWAYSLTCMLMIVFVFMSLARSTREEIHVQINLVYNHLPAQMQRFAQLIWNIAGLIAFALIGWQSVAYAIVILKESTPYSPELPVSAAIAYVVIAFGCFLACLRLVLRFVNLLVHKKKLI